MKFHQAQESDVPFLRVLLSKAWRFTYQAIHAQEDIEKVISDFYNEERLRHEVSHFSKAWSGYYVVEDEGQIRICIGGGVDEENIGHIYVLYADPDFRQRGYGRFIVESFTKLLQEQYHISKQRVSVAQKNQLGLPFYEKLGFEVIAEQDSYGLEGKYKTWLMERNIES